MPLSGPPGLRGRWAGDLTFQVLINPGVAADTTITNIAYYEATSHR